MKWKIEDFKITESDLVVDEDYEIFFSGKRTPAIYLGKVREKKGLTNVLLVAASGSKKGEGFFHLRMFQPTYLEGKRLYLGKNFSVKMDSKNEGWYLHRLAEKGFLDKIT